MYRTGYGPADRDRRPAPPGRGGTRPPSPPGFRRDQPAGLPANYLAGGYFDENGNLRLELVSDLAQEVAKEIRSAPLRRREPMAYSQLRSFWSITQGIRNRLLAQDSFSAVKADIQMLSTRAANAVSREVVPPVFKEFIDSNVALALRSAKDFQKGFVPHFEAVVAFYYSLEHQDKAR
ncbi:MAG: type III-A CRISPR-associated protein Csm2 [Bacillota bacterium]|nr:type III-A CRISPR-associated protein Csm2 [Bacillota bacterium]